MYKDFLDNKHFKFLIEKGYEVYMDGPTTLKILSGKKPDVYTFYVCKGTNQNKTTHDLTIDCRFCFNKNNNFISHHIRSDSYSYLHNEEDVVYTYIDTISKRGRDYTKTKYSRRKLLFNSNTPHNNLVKCVKSTNTNLKEFPPDIWFWDENTDVFNIFMDSRGNLYGDSTTIELAKEGKLNISESDVSTYCLVPIIAGLEIFYDYKVPFYSYKESIDRTVRLCGTNYRTYQTPNHTLPDIQEIFENETGYTKLALSTNSSKRFYARLFYEENLRKTIRHMYLSGIMSAQDLKEFKTLLRSSEFRSKLEQLNSFKTFTKSERNSTFFSFLHTCKHNNTIVSEILKLNVNTPGDLVHKKIFSKPGDLSEVWDACDTSRPDIFAHITPTISFTNELLKDFSSSIIQGKDLQGNTQISVAIENILHLVKQTPVLTEKGYRYSDKKYKHLDHIIRFLGSDNLVKVYEEVISRKIPSRAMDLALSDLEIQELVGSRKTDHIADILIKNCKRGIIRNSKEDLEDLINVILKRQ